MLAKVALLGRPNVGKSTLFNRLIRSKRAITHDRPGVTRDRMEGLVRIDGEKAFTLIDTGGLTLDEHNTVLQGPEGLRGFEEKIMRQTEVAIQDAAVLCLVVDGRDGLLPLDEHLALFARKAGKPLLLVINKVDGAEREDEMTAEFHALGMPIIAISAEHGHGIYHLQEKILENLPKTETVEDEKTQDCIKLALLGRPNAGKSSLVNAIIGEDRMIVSEIAGTTRDSVDLPVEINGRSCIFVDTAGVRRKSKITDTVERYSVNSSLKSTTKADVTLYIIDATESVAAQDKRLIALLDERKTPFFILVNKIDLINKKDRKNLEKDLHEILQFCPHIPLRLVSALKRIGLKEIVPLAVKIHDECQARISTGLLNRTLEEVLTRHQPPVVKNVRPKFFYLTQAEINPPTFVFFVSDAERISETYARYLERSLRERFGIQYAPMRIRLRSSHK